MSVAYDQKCNCPSLYTHTHTTTTTTSSQPQHCRWVLGTIWVSNATSQIQTYSGLKHTTHTHTGGLKLWQPFSINKVLVLDLEPNLVPSGPWSLFLCKRLDMMAVKIGLVLAPKFCWPATKKRWLQGLGYYFVGMTTTQTTQFFS